jgi:hypothetical protein
LLVDSNDNKLSLCVSYNRSLTNFVRFCRIHFISVPKILHTRGSILMHRPKVDIWDRPCTLAEIGLFGSFFDGDAKVKRKGIPGTLHRVSLITHPMRNPVQVLGVAVRVGRALQGLIETMIGGVSEVYLACKTGLFSIHRRHMAFDFILRSLTNIS